MGEFLRDTQHSRPISTGLGTPVDASERGYILPWGDRTRTGRRVQDILPCWNVSSDRVQADGRFTDRTTLNLVQLCLNAASNRGT